LHAVVEGLFVELLLEMTGVNPPIMLRENLHGTL